jgi:hypothetical protein
MTCPGWSIGCGRSHIFNTSGGPGRVISIANMDGTPDDIMSGQRYSKKNYCAAASEATALQMLRITAAMPAHISGMPVDKLHGSL